jgi:trigger factor
LNDPSEPAPAGDSGETIAPARVSVQEESSVERRLEVEIDPAHVDAAWDRAYRALAQRVRVRGFRPGKAPRSVLEKLYGGALAGEVEHSLVARSLPRALRESGLEPASEPSIDAGPPAPGATFRYVARVEIRPEVALPGLAGLPARKPRVEVGVADVEGELERLRQHRASLLEEPEGTAARAGHVVTLDYDGTLDGEAFEEGRGRDVAVELGSGRLLPGFEEQLLGAGAGDAREVRIRFPEDWQPASLAGRDAVFAVRVKELKRREVPELDDEFAKDLGEFESLSALRERVRADLVGSRERESRRVLVRTLLDSLLERTSFEVPAGLVEAQLRRRLDQAHRELEPSVPHDVLHRQIERWQEEWRPIAEREVREELVLDAVVRERGIEVEEAELDARLVELAGPDPKEQQRLRRSWRERGLHGALRAGMAREKALDILLGEAKVEETTGT